MAPTQSILTARPATNRLTGIVFLLILGVFFGVPASGEQPSASPAKPSQKPTPIPLTMVPGQARLTIASLQEVDAAVSRDLSNVADVAASLSQLKSEIDTRIGEDINLLKASPFLDLLYQLQSTWQNFSGDLSALDRKVAERATNLEAGHSRVDQLSETWQATLQSATQPDTPQSVLHNAQATIDAIGHTRQKIDSGRIQLLTVQGDLSEQEARVGTALSSVEQAQDQALKSLLVRDSPPVWAAGTSLASEWEEQSEASFSAQWHASIAFVQRYTGVFLALPLLIVLIAGAFQLMRHKLRKVVEEKPDLQRALPILDLPVSMALVLSLLTVLSLCPQAPRFILAVLGGIALVPTVLILRKLLFANSHPILYALVILALVGELRMLTVASLPYFGRLLFLVQTLGASCFLIWVLRSWRLPTAAAETHGRLWRRIRAIAKIGLILMPVAFLANCFGYVQLGNLLGLIFLRSVFVAALLYTAIRIIEGLIVIALEIPPLSRLHLVTLHRLMLQRRIFSVLSFLAFLLWLSAVDLAGGC